MSNAGSLKSRALSAGIWATVVAVGGTAMRFGSSLIMTRLLVPDVFGVVALAHVLYAIVSLLADIGLRQSVIYHEKGEQQHFLDTVWSLSAVRGVFIALSAALCAWVVSAGAGNGWFSPTSVYMHPQLPAVLTWMALSSLWMGLKSPKLYLLERRLDFKTIGYIDVLAQLAGTVVTIVLTYKWRSVWPIVIGSHVTALTMTALSHFAIKGPVGRMSWDPQIVKDVVNYGRWILLSSIAFVIASNGDRLLLGLWITPALLGFYMLALNIVSAVELIISRPFSAVGMPAFSEVARRGGGDLRKVYFKFRLPFDLATLALSGVLFAAGPLIVHALYDERYAAAGATLQILALTLVFPRFNVSATVHAALGYPQTGSLTNAAKLVSILICIPLGHAIAGYQGAMWGIALHMLPSVMITFWRNHRFQLNDFGYEAKVLAAWPLGYVVGLGLVAAGRPTLAWLGIEV